MEWINNYNAQGDNREILWDEHVVVWKDGRAILAKAGYRWLYDKYNPSIIPMDHMNIVKDFNHYFKVPKAPISMLANHMDDHKFWHPVDKMVDGNHRNGKQVLFYGILKKGERPDYHLGHWVMEPWANRVLVNGEKVEEIEFYRFIDEPQSRQVKMLTGGFFSVSGGSGGSTVTHYNVWRTGTFKSSVPRIDKI